MRFLMFLMVLFSMSCFAQDFTLEERVSNIEQRMINMGSYIEQHCTLIQEYTGSSTTGCFDGYMTHHRITLRKIGERIYVNNFIDCKRYRLVCR